MVDKKNFFSIRNIFVITFGIVLIIINFLAMKNILDDKVVGVISEFAFCFMFVIGGIQSLRNGKKLEALFYLILALLTLLLFIPSMLGWYK